MEHSKIYRWPLHPETVLQLRRRRLIYLTLTALLFILMGAPLLSCSSVPIKDEIAYGNKGMQGAVEFHTMTSSKRELSFEQWMQLLKAKPLVCTSVEAFGDFKAAVEKLCSVCNCCSYEAKAALEQFFTNVQTATGGK
jgi:hypothetical protein